MLKVEHQIEINQPVEVVFNYLSDFNNNLEWTSQVVEAQWETPGAVKVGSKSLQVSKLFGRRIQTVAEVIEYQPNQKIVSRLDMRGIMATITYQFEELANTKAGAITRLYYQVEGQLPRLLKFAAPLMVNSGRRSVIKDLANLKAVLENRY